MRTNRTILVAECATAHGGSLKVAERMIAAAADAGCDYVKFQSYTLESLNPEDKQYDWLVNARLDEDAHRRLMAQAENCGIKFMSTPFDRTSLVMLSDLKVPIKIASTDAQSDWWHSVHSHKLFAISYPWGEGATSMPVECHQLTAIPLYPTPIEAVGRAKLLDGWSDHCVGLSGCRWAMARGATVIEAHLCLPGESREMVWDKHPGMFEDLRVFADDMDAIRAGFSTGFRERWRR